MAHKVKCFYCGQTFDRDKFPFVKVGERRYAHAECSEKISKEASAEEKARQELYSYIDELFNKNVNWGLVGKQIKKYKEELNYTYSGMLKCLIYVYKIKHGDISKAKGVGVIPINYKDAYNYYFSIWEANQKNEQKIITDYKPVEKIIKIPVPQRNIKKRKLFSFLDEEDSGAK